MSQSQPLRIENAQLSSFGTCRTVGSALWFVNNSALEDRILGYLAKYQEKYTVNLYSFVFFGSHFHLVSKFPGMNRASFYRDLNARSAEAVRALAEGYTSGPLFERRYSEQALPTVEDIEEQFFYCALQPVLAGLCERVSEYPGYNSFNDAISGIEREFSVVDWAAYNAAKRYNPAVSLKNHTTVYKLKYSRLPGYEHMSQKDYKKLMLEKLEKRRQEIVSVWVSKGRRFLKIEELRKVIPGTPARNPKKSNRYSFRPLVLTKCLEAKRVFLEWYFSIYTAYKKAVKKFFAGELNVEFPPGTYRPPYPTPV